MWTDDGVSFHYSVVEGLPTTQAQSKELNSNELDTGSWRDFRRNCFVRDLPIIAESFFPGGNFLLQFFCPVLHHHTLAGTLRVGAPDHHEVLAVRENVVPCPAVVAALDAQETTEDYVKIV